MSELTDVQNPMIQYAGDIGWEYISPQDALALRHGDRGVIFTSVVKEQLLALNPGIVNDERADEIIRQLNLLKPTVEGNKDALSWLKGEHSVYVPEEKRERNVRLIDFDDVTNNRFHVTMEWWQRSAVYANRADVVFLINGIPIALAECKAAGKPDGLAIGVDQIRRYHRETPEIFVSTQVFEVTQLLDFFYGVSWNTSRKNLFNWKDEVKGDYERKVKAFFDRERFLQVLKDYIVFVASPTDQLSKIILRQHQTRAVERVINRVHDTGKRRGLIWHTQGSGKTYTMITIAAKLLKETQGAEKPTVLMIVDRNELQSQLDKNLKGYGIKVYRMAGSKMELQRILASDYRGLVVSMVHKFDDIPADINTRESIIVLVDEAHRTTGGDLGNYLMAALPNATYIGFTGTPIDRLSKGKGTFKVFGKDDEEKGYLDKYSIAESIEDGTTVALNYSHAPSELMVNKEVLEKEFWSLAASEGVSDIEELNAILDRAVELKEMMKSPQRMDKVAELVAQHYTANVEPMGFKAFLVAVDREACALYKQCLDKYLPTEYSTVVYSAGMNDSELLKQYYLTEDAEKEVRKDFSTKGKLPKILIVTEKLLTGFDAPILYCMYLDKPMRDHVLLQTIARVNRPYEDDDGLEKKYGFVLDFVGIFDKLEKALAFDSDVVASVIQNLDVLKNRFKELMENEAQAYLPLTKGWGDKAKERAIDFFEDKDDREEFYRFFRQIQSLYDIITPDAFLRPWIEDYGALAELFGLIRQKYTQKPYVDKELTAKTKALLQKHTQGLNFSLSTDVTELGKEQLDAIRSGNASNKAKLLNLMKLIGSLVDEEGNSKPFLLPIGERAEILRQAYEDRQLATQEALQAFLQLAQEYVDADGVRRALDVDENTFAIYTALKTVEDKTDAKDASDVDGVFKEHPDYQWNGHEENRLRAKLYKLLKPLVGKKYIDVANTLLKLRRV